MKRQTKRNGQSLVEIMIGIALAVVFIVGVATVIAPALQIGKETTQAQTKTELASELLDNVRAWAAGNWDNVLALATGTVNTYYLNSATSPFTVLSNTSSTTTTSTAAIAFVQSTSTDPEGAAHASVAFQNNVSAGDLIIVGGYSTIGATVTATDTLGDTFTRVASKNNTGNNESVILVATTSASGADTVTISGNVIYTASIHEYGGIAIDSIANMIDTSSTAQGSSKNPNSGNITTTDPNDLIFGWLTNGNNSEENDFTDNPYYTKRELASGISQYCGGIANCVNSMDWITTSTVTTAATGTLVATDGWAAIVVAFKAGIVSTTTITGNTTGTESVAIGSTIFTRYFYLSDVYRDANGNVTTTASGNNYDPSTKLITIVVNASSTNSGPPSTLSFYLTRNGSNNFNQTSWAGGSGQNSPITLVGTSFASSSNITVSATGSIQLTSGGTSCVL